MSRAAKQHPDVVCRSTFKRLRTLVQILNRSRTPVSAATLATKLEVSTKCIYIDLDFLRDQIGLPIISNSGGSRYDSKGYYLVEKLCLCDLCCRPV